ncbi:MAG: helix-turn-helix transcriptional regulator [Desulfohalobiaceae bacterium]|nr:helix-turn-helix transcriptional regulator [Desulfohalobiaceae bacterium]
MAKSVYTTRFYPDKLRNLIKEGKTAQEIMNELSISRFTLKEHLLLLQRKDKTNYEISGLFEDREADKRMIKRRRGYICAPGSSYLPAFSSSDTFEMIEQDDRIILKKIY